jgi:hypothetical protein
VTALYGETSVEFYQITPLGWARFQDPNSQRGVDVATRDTLADLAELGGVADVDELKFAGRQANSPQITRTCLNRLVDLGWVEAVVASPQAPAGGA